jgi:hypothetical protein
MTFGITTEIGYYRVIAWTNKAPAWITKTPQPTAPSRCLQSTQPPPGFPSVNRLKAKSY